MIQITHPDTRHMLIPPVNAVRSADFQITSDIRRLYVWARANSSLKGSDMCDDDIDLYAHDTPFLQTLRSPHPVIYSYRLQNMTAAIYKQKKKKRERDVIL